MAYQIDRYNNTLLTNVEDGTVDQTTDLKFIGKNYAGYGEIQNENFLFLLENFSGANQPSRPISGQVWFDSANSKLKFYDGSKWRTTGGAEVSTTQPAGLTEGDFWWDETNDQLYVYNGVSFILIGPQNAGEGVTQMQSLSVIDDQGNTQGVIAATIEDVVVAIISENATAFTLGSSNTITGFDKINHGINLVDTKNAAAGVTTSGARFHGTATNADRLGGNLASEYVRTQAGGTPTTFQSAVILPDTGIRVGEGQDLQLLVENGDEGVIQNISTPSSLIKFKATSAGGILTHVATLTAGGWNPAADNTFDIGTASLRWKDMYAVNFVGEATKATTLREGTDYRTASVATAANTVVVRDSSSNINANLFEGTATQARYADLAEKYTTGEELAPGTAVAVCTHDDHEVEPASASDIAIGVVSTDPAYMMNSDAEGQYIGLKGRLPVRVKGPVRKGDAIYAMADGVCTTLAATALVGVALESNDAEDEKLVECVLKV
jgi:hypothetical protein